MSWEASGWAKSVRTCPNGEMITRSEKFLLLILADYHNHQIGAAFASVTRIADDAISSERQCRYLLRSLETKGLIVTIIGRLGKTNSYKFPLMEKGRSPKDSLLITQKKVGQRLPHGGAKVAPDGAIAIAGDGATAIAPKPILTKKIQEEGRSGRAVVDKSAKAKREALELADKLKKGDPYRHRHIFSWVHRSFNNEFSAEAILRVLKWLTENKSKADKLHDVWSYLDSKLQATQTELHQGESSKFKQGTLGEVFKKVAQEIVK